MPCWSCRGKTHALWLPCGFTSGPTRFCRTVHSLVLLCCFGVTSGRTPPAKRWSANLLTGITLPVCYAHTTRDSLGASDGRVAHPNCPSLSSVGIDLVSVRCRRRFIRVRPYTSSRAASGYSFGVSRVVYRGRPSQNRNFGQQGDFAASPSRAHRHGLAGGVTCRLRQGVSRQVHTESTAPDLSLG